MSSPIPALNPARSHDTPVAVEAMVPLVRRAQLHSDALADDAAVSRQPSDDHTDSELEPLDESPIMLDGNLFAMAALVCVPLRPRKEGGPWPLRHLMAGQVGGRSADAAAGNDLPASGSTAMSSVARHALAAQAPTRHLPSNGLGYTPSLPAPDVSLSADVAEPRQVLPLLPSAPSSAKPADSQQTRAGGPTIRSSPVPGGPAEGSRVPLPEPASGALEPHAGASAAQPRGGRRAASDTAIPPLHAAGHAPARPP